VEKWDCAAANPGKLHFGVSAASSSIHIFSPSEDIQELYWERLKGHCFYLEIYVALIA